MKKMYNFWMAMVILLFGVILISGCGETPKLTLKPTNGPDLTGAMKYQLWTSYIIITPEQTKGNDPNKGFTEKPEYELQGAVARNPYKPIILIEAREEFFASTKLTYSPVKNTMMPEKLTVAVEDKTEKRIEQLGALAKPILSLAFFT
jgi:hypothetical protein